jgi:hypothetical protein
MPARNGIGNAWGEVEEIRPMPWMQARNGRSEQNG